MMNELIKNEISKFKLNCDKMLNSKLALVDKQISDILNVIAESKYIYNLITEYTVGYNFDREYKAVVSKIGVFELPTKSEQIVPFVFILLSKINDKKIDIIKLLSKNFSSYDQNPYQSFLNIVISKFYESVVELLNLNNNYEINSVKKDKKLTNELASRIEYLCRELERKLSNIKKVSSGDKRDIKIIIDALSSRLKVGDQSSVIALFLGIRHIVGNNRQLIEKLNEIQKLIDIIK